MYTEAKDKMVVCSWDLCLSPLIIVSPDYYFRFVPDVHRGCGLDGCFGVVIYACHP